MTAFHLQNKIAQLDNHGDQRIGIMALPTQNCMLRCFHRTQQFLKKNIGDVTAPGISFIEILVLLLLISIATSMLAPRFITNRPGKLQKQFFSELSMLIADTTYQSIMSKKVYQVFWDFNTHTIAVKKHQKMPGEPNKNRHFVDIPKDIFHSKIKIPEQFTIRNFIVQGKDEMTTGKKLDDAWFFIMPDGTSQPVTINIDDETQDTIAHFSITINPFYSQATLHDHFQKGS